MKPIVSRTLSIHQEHEVLLKLEAAGLNDELAQKIVGSKDNELATEVVELIRTGGFAPTTSQQSARAIMGANCFGVEEAIRHFGITPTRTQRAALAEIPFSEEVLKSCCDTHLLVATFPLSILDIRGKVPERTLYSQDWYNKEKFAKDRGEAGWHLVRKTPVPDSIIKTWDEQQKLLGPDEETPSARIMVYAIVGHFLATGERLFLNIYVRCVDLDSHGGRVYVGGFDADGLCVFDYWGAFRFDLIGVSAARKSD